MSAPWAREARVVLAVLAGSLFLGVFVGHAAWTVAAGLLGYALTLLYQLDRLRRWVVGRPKGPPPEMPGLWGEIAHHISRHERDMERRQDRMADILERFRRVSAAVPDAMVVLSPEDLIEWANPAAERLLGLRSPRDQGARIMNLVRSPDFQDYLRLADYSQNLQLSSPARADCQLSVQIVPFGDSLRLLIARDVTHLARLDEMRQHFVANVSHELRTPVTVLSGFVETLRDSSACSEEWRGHFDLMYEQAQRMQRLIEDLLTLSRLETSPPHVQEEPVNVPALLVALKTLGDTLAAGGPAIRLEVEGDLGLLGNGEELRSAFSNLLNNAIRHTPAQGEVRMSWRRDREGVRLSVSDTGEGIASHHIPHLTERFYRVDTARSRAGGGTGLGLSIVKHILRRHDARLAIESRLGAGSTFSCIFPGSRAVSLSQS